MFENPFLGRSLAVIEVFRALRAATERERSVVCLCLQELNVSEAQMPSVRVFGGHHRAVLGLTELFSWRIS